MTQSISHDQETSHDQATTFAELGVTDDICAALADNGITTAFPIQELAIPIALSGADLIGQARTGTGKTLAFGIPILQRLQLPGRDGFDEFDSYGKPQALVMAPTRELALQVAADLAIAGSRTPARVVTIYGGVSYDDQLAALRKGVDVVVGTPGRLLDLAHQHALDLSHVEFLVLDEADEMLDLGFLPDVQKLTAMTPPSRQSLLFSATMPAAIISLVRESLNQPVHVRAEGSDTQATVPDTTQFIYQAHELDKPEIIAKLLQAEAVGKVMVFTRTKRSAQRLADELDERGFNSRAIHGDLNQSQREKTLKLFRKNQLKVLVATDVAARGIDVAGVSHVVNYEVPDDPKQYVHRIGRTGRAGAKGVAVTLVDWQDITRWNVINKALQLGKANPPETYSTSAHLLSDLHIPEDAKGRVAAAKPDDDHPGAQHQRPSRRRRRSERSHAERSNDQHTHDEQSHVEQPQAVPDRPRRVRRRTRNGQVVERTSRETAPQQPASS